MHGQIIAVQSAWNLQGRKATTKTKKDYQTESTFNHRPKVFPRICNIIDQPRSKVVYGFVIFSISPDMKSYWILSLVQYTPNWPLWLGIFVVSVDQKELLDFSIFNHVRSTLEFRFTTLVVSQLSIIICFLSLYWLSKLIFVDLRKG